MASPSGAYIGHILQPSFGSARAHDEEIVGRADDTFQYIRPETTDSRPKTTDHRL